MTKIVHCNCIHEWQDQRYGSGRRVANSCKEEKEWRCTVCGQVVGSGTADVGRKKK